MKYAIIGGTGLNELATNWQDAPTAETPYGDASCVPQVGSAGSHEVVFLARHGQPHRIAPHAINYRANLWLLQQLEVDAVIASYAVGGIANDLENTDIVLPHQIIDYTWGREQSFSDAEQLLHVDFTDPFDASLHDQLVLAARAVELPGALHETGVYGCTQGPRLESAAEIDRMDRDGCTIVGMTGMPEAGLARELELPYAGISLVVNKAAGRSSGPIASAVIQQAVADGMQGLVRILFRFLEQSD